MGPLQPCTAFFLAAIARETVYVGSYQKLYFKKMNNIARHGSWANTRTRHISLVAF